MATCSKIATTGTKIIPGPRSLRIASKVIVSVSGSVLLAKAFSVQLNEVREWSSSSRSKLKGGNLKWGIPDLISPIRVVYTIKWSNNWWLTGRQTQGASYLTNGMAVVHKSPLDRLLGSPKWRLKRCGTSIWTKGPCLRTDYGGSTSCWTVS